jgi:hypothetical protein
VRVTAIRCPMSLRRGDHLPFIDQGEGDLQACRTILLRVASVAYSVGELTTVLANLAPVAVSWRALYLNRSGFEGRGVVVDQSAFRWARGSR